MEISEIINKRNLLAYSAGTDSSALYHMLEENGIEFDLIMVNYNIREESTKEVHHALKLKRKMYLYNTHMKTNSNFEKKARDLRYKFFDKKMKNYDNLILGHNLSDKTEWFLMQFTRGAGLKELSGMTKVSKRKNYQIVRPLLDYSKEEILIYLKKNNIKYFYDKSNDNEKYTRNYFRHNFSEPLLKEHKKGILKTFKILEKEKLFIKEGTLIKKEDNYEVYEIEFQFATNLLSQIFKKKGVVLTGGQREEFESNEEIVLKIKDNIYAATFKDNTLSISPYLKNIMPKEFREKMRKEKIHPKHRGYLYSKLED